MTGSYTPYPMALQGAGRDYVWGGNRLERLYGKTSGGSRTAESWELSCRAEAPSIIANGPLAGKPLAEVLGEDFPLLVKLLDAREALSIQVHPGDDTADADAGEQGKTELWYILDAEPGSFLYCGLNRDVSARELLGAAKDGSVETLLNRVPVRPGDSYFIEPGTIHALGAGVLAAEVQQSSDTTFRLFDYDRTDGNGRPRKLQPERGCAAARLTKTEVNNLRRGAVTVLAGAQLRTLADCGHFCVQQLDVEEAVTLRHGGFAHLLFLEGSGHILWNEEQYPFSPGSSYFLPEGLGDYRVLGRASALLTRI